MSTRVHTNHRQIHNRKYQYALFSASAQMTLIRFQSNYHQYVELHKNIGHIKNQFVELLIGSNCSLLYRITYSLIEYNQVP